MTAPSKAKRGRPALSKVKWAAYESPLAKMLQERLPDFVVRGRLNVSRLAAALEMTNAGVYHWLNYNRVSPDGARKLVDLSKGSLTAQHLSTFVI